jgi:hypothetical protein
MASNEATKRRGRFRWKIALIGIAVIVILSTAQVVGALIHNLNQTRMGAIFAIGVVSFLGMLSLGAEGREIRSNEIRTALTTAFSMVFFAAVGIFLFSTNAVSDFGQALMSNLTSLFGVVIGFYFASSALVEFGKTRAAGPDLPAAAQAQEDTEALKAEIVELRAKVAALEGKPGDGAPRRTRSGTTRPT